MHGDEGKYRETRVTLIFYVRHPDADAADVADIVEAAAARGVRQAFSARWSFQRMSKYAEPLSGGTGWTAVGTEICEREESDE